MKKYMLIFIVLLLLFLVPLQWKKQEKEKGKEACVFQIPIANSETTIPLEDYIIGVINGEMPASFHLEALKAQAIAARTYAIYQTNYGQKPIQTTTAHQVYSTDIDPAYKDKLEQAVLETANQILTYNGQPISAMFHAASNGQTESAENYSGSQVAYLQSVPSPEQYVDTKTFTLAEMNQLLQTNFTLQHIQNARITKNSTKRVSAIQIHNKSFTGREFREKLSLKSTDFSLSVSADEQIHITTHGYGHGVGMSQYGANERAHQQEKASDILAHYYPSTKIEELHCKK